LTFAGSAGADNANPNVVPIGENESYLGNTGIGRPNDTGAVYYNPAGLAEISSAKVALSGTVFASVSEHSDGITAIEGTNVPFDASGFNTIPTAFVGTAKLGDWVGAVSILVPLSLQFGGHSNLAVPSFVTNLVYSDSETEEWYGLSIARKLSPGFSVGLSLFGIQHQETYLSGLDMASLTTVGAFATSTQRTSVNVYGLLATLGISYVVSDAVRFGLRVQTAMAQLYGKGESFAVTRDVPVTGSPTVAGENVSGQVNYAIPFDVGLGAALKPVEGLTFLADISLQLPASYQTFPASMNSEPVSLQATPRFNLGMEAVPVAAYPLRVGFYYDPSTRGGHPGEPNYQNADFCGLTAGVGFNAEHVRTAVGGFYIWSSGQMTPSGTTSSVAYSITGVGAMLTTAYVF
jgi:hypothetical protein